MLQAAVWTEAKDSLKGRTSPAGTLTLNFQFRDCEQAHSVGYPPSLRQTNTESLLGNTPAICLGNILQTLTSSSTEILLT